MGQQAWLALRPEKIRIGREQPQSGVNVIPGKVEDIGYLGSISHYHVRTASGQRVTALRANAASRGRAVDKLGRHTSGWTGPIEAGVVLTR